MKIKYHYGKVYFRVSYADISMRYPNIESFVYVGKNISDEDKEDAFYFQPARDFSKYGSIMNAGRTRTSPVVCVPENEMQEMMNIEELAAALTAAQIRILPDAE
jgi:hypothetical protein